MKKELLAVILLMLSSLVSAQELTVTYSAKYNTNSPDVFIESGLNKEMRSSLAQAYKDVVLQYELAYKDGQSEFRVLPPEGDMVVIFMGQTIDVGAAMKKQAKNCTYKNHQTNCILSQTTAFGKNFLVTDSLTSTKFKVEKGKNQIILGFECKKAVSLDGKSIAWYTKQIPVRDEPIATGLDGLVLKYSDSNMIYTATKIDQKVNHVITKPTTGTEISKQDFSDMMKKRVEMMKRN